MASNDFVLRCKTQKGPVTLTELKCDSTVEELKFNLVKLTQLDSKTMKFLSGYPPKPLVITSDNLKLCDLDIKSGDTLIIESQNVPESVKSPIIDAGEGSFNEMIFNQSGIMMRHVVPSNNSCLFTSFYFIVCNGEMNLEKSNGLRKIIADVVSHNPEKYTTAYLGKPNLEYCKWIQNPAHWGGAIELEILSDQFKLEIVAIDTVNLLAHRFGEINDYKERIFLIYDGIHYDPLVLESESATQMMFKTNDPRPMEMAMELAKEAKSSRQFTDTANFTTSCRVCNAKFVGQKEVAEHARVTGHCEFGEI